MATIKTATVKQSYNEIRIWDFDFTNDLSTGVTVSSATATHVPPSGVAVTPTVGVISSNIVPVKVTSITNVEGMHTLRCMATLSNTEKSEIILYITVIA
jgi:hypothetical protein